MSAKRFYAIGIPGWVQIRRAGKRPIATRTSCVTKGGNGRHFTMKQVYYEGGQIVEHIPATTFSIASNVQVAINECRVIPKRDRYAIKKAALWDY